MTIEQLEHEVLKLPLHVRARLAERLIASLDEEAEIERAWVEEAQRRVARLEAGETTTRPVEDALREIRASL
jgi:putative addiction module component (TIGR02574 family)